MVGYGRKWKVNIETSTEILLKESADDKDC
jgi:hypothetical protein